MTFHLRPATDDDIGRQLAAFATARLSPSPAATARMRARVMAAMEARAGDGASAGAPFALVADSRRLNRPRRALVALLAAATAAPILAGVALASGPGGPLYGVRLWVETVSLPSNADARADADVGRLDVRVDEAVSAAGNGNDSAVAAALAAYRDILADATRAAEDGDAPDDRLEAALDRHQAVLAGLLTSATDPALVEIRDALEKSGEAAKDLRGPKPDAGPDKPKGGDKGRGTSNPQSTPPAARPGHGHGHGHGHGTTPKSGPGPSPSQSPPKGKSGVAPGKSGIAPGKSGPAPGH